MKYFLTWFILIGLGLFLMIVRFLGHHLLPSAHLQPVLGLLALPLPGMAGGVTGPSYQLGWSAVLSSCYQGTRQACVLRVSVQVLITSFRLPSLSQTEACPGPSRPVPPPPHLGQCDSWWTVLSGTARLWRHTDQPNRSDEMTEPGQAPPPHKAHLVNDNIGSTGPASWGEGQALRGHSLSLIDFFKNLVPTRRGLASNWPCVCVLLSASLFTTGHPIREKYKTI